MWRCGISLLKEVGEVAGISLWDQGGVCCCLGVGRGEKTELHSLVRLVLGGICTCQVRNYM